MKKIILGLIVLVAMVGMVGYAETHYTMDSTVSAVRGDEVCVIDSVGEEFSYFDDNAEELTVGQNVKVTFHTNYTSNNRHDDRVVNVKM